MLASRAGCSWLLGLLMMGALLQTGCCSSASVHTVIPTECSPYMLWQSVGFYFSHRRSGQPGPFTRIVCCDSPDKVSAEELSLVPTHLAPSYTFNPHNSDAYLPYNKPVAIMDWLGRNDVREEYVLVIDVDMILRAPLLPEALGARPGFAVAAFFDYLHGTHNELAERHLADVAPRQDELAGPAGRRADMVGGAYLAHREDMRRIAPLWLKYTENVRDDPRAWELAGEPGRAPGERPWICEMYGYSFAAARLGVWHRADQSLMLYPGYYPADPLPRVLHYGLLWNVSAGYEFNKHWHFQFDMLACPPWKLGESGLFKHPAHPRSLRSKGAELLKDLLAMEAIIYLNAAFCERHRARCPHSKALNWECSKAETLLKAYDAAWKAAVLAM